MAKKIIWSQKARIKLFAVLEFYTERNGNKKYAAKLYSIFNKEIKLLIRNPDLGIQSSNKAVRGLIVMDYIIFYEVNDSSVIIHTLWPTNQDPEKLRV